jgi:hypothetical protein
VGVLEELFPQKTRNRPGLAITYDSAVNIDDTNDLGSRSGEEKFIANI